MATADERATLPPWLTIRRTGEIEGLARHIAERIVDTLAFRLKDEWVAMAHLAISGGVVIDAVITALADNPAPNRIDWTKVHVWWTDERYLPDGHIGRHETKARIAGIARIGIPESNLHVIPAAEADQERPDLAAEAYHRVLRRFAPHGRRLPVFDLLLLEVGPGGEVAGLRPGHHVLRETADVVPLWDAANPCRLQVTTTLPAIAEAVRVWVLATGTEKAVAVGRSVLHHTGGIDIDAPPPPAGLVRGGLETVWWLDRHAARAIPTELLG